MYTITYITLFLPQSLFQIFKVYSVYTRYDLPQDRESLADGLLPTLRGGSHVKHYITNLASKYIVLLQSDALVRQIESNLIMKSHQFILTKQLNRQWAVWAGSEFRWQSNFLNKNINSSYILKQQIQSYLINNSSTKLRFNLKQ